MSFISFLKAVGHDFKKVFTSPVIQQVELGAAEVGGLLFPALGPLFNQTAQAVILAEQKAAALGNQDGSGPQKAADVLQILGPVIAVALKDAGKDSSAAGIQKYIDAVVLVLNTLPAPPTIPTQG